MPKYLLAHDLGTSGNKATLFTTDGEYVKSVVGEYGVKFYNSNWAEQNPEDWWEAVCSTSRELMQGIDAADVAVVSMSGQMMGCLCVDKKGMPLYNSIIWADMRGVKEEQQMRESIGADAVYNITGHRASASYSLAKLLWLRNNEPNVYKNTYKMLNAKDYIILKLTGNFLTDFSDASGTNAFDLNTFTWSDSILDNMDVDRKLLPEAVPSTHIAGEVSGEAAQACGLAAGTPVVMGAGDGSSASVGAGSVAEGVTYNCLGSSSWIGTTTKKMILDPNQILFNWAHAVPGYISPCGTMQAAGASYAWMKQQLCEYEVKTAEHPYDAINGQIAQSPPGANGLYYLPYLLGERSPRWNPNARGAFLGLKMEHTHKDMLRSVVEGVGFNLKIILSLMQQYVEVSEITILGGLAKSEVCSQIFTDIFGIEVNALNHLEEATSIGAAVIGGVGIGALSSFAEVSKFVHPNQFYKPNAQNKERYEKMLRIFDQSYYALKDVYDEMAELD